MGYYPTPPDVVGRIRSFLSYSDENVSVLDPCCGEGLALEALGQALTQRSSKAVQTWGVEISPERAQEATARLDLVVAAPFEAISWSPARHGVARPRRTQLAPDVGGALSRLEAFDHRALDSSCGPRLAGVLQHHRGGENRGKGVGAVGSGIFGSRPVHGLEHRSRPGMDVP